MPETNSVASLTTSAVDSFADNLCEICWNNLKAKVVLVPCGHACFCDSCAVVLKHDLQLHRNVACVYCPVLN